MNKSLKICFVSTFVPRECGIATYANNLISAIKTADKSVECQVFSLSDGQRYSYPDIVSFVIEENSDEDYIKAAELLNNSDVDLVSIQHEFGIFGGFNGNKVLIFLKKLKKPCFITFHTIPIKLLSPYKIQAKKHKSRTNLLRRIFPLVSGVTVMTETAKDFLVKNFNIPHQNIFVIPHGAPGLSPKMIENDKRKKESLGFNKNDFVLSTFGLISSKKGLEYAIKALPLVIKENPTVAIKYAILGRTHPSKPTQYLDSLVALTKTLNLEKNVIFDSRYLSYDEIYTYLANTDIYITPYYTKEQASSGTLSYAIAAGKCVVSTPYVFAGDVIRRHKVGELVEFKSSKSVADVLNRLIKNRSKIKEYEANSRRYGEEIEWPKIGGKFIKAFKQEAGK